MDRRYTATMCECGDAWCAGCEDAEIEHDNQLSDAHASNEAEEDDPTEYAALLPDDLAAEMRGEI